MLQRYKQATTFLLFRFVIVCMSLLLAFVSQTYKQNHKRPNILQTFLYVFYFNISWYGNLGPIIKSYPAGAAGVGACDALNYSL